MSMFSVNVFSQNAIKSDEKSKEECQISVILLRVFLLVIIGIFPNDEENLVPERYIGCRLFAGRYFLRGLRGLRKKFRQRLLILIMLLVLADISIQSFNNQEYLLMFTVVIYN